MATRVPALIQLSDPRVAAQQLVIYYAHATSFVDLARQPVQTSDNTALTPFRRRRMPSGIFQWGHSAYMHCYGCDLPQSVMINARPTP